MKRTLGFSVAAALVLACGDHSPTGVQTAISDGAHEDADHPGNPDFFFLPPMVRDPSGHPDFEAGKFNGSLAPTVEICELAETNASNISPESSCSDPQPTGFPITFTTTTGPGSETVRVNSTDEHYIVNWQTDLLALSATRFYRIRVRVGSFGLGFADVDVVDNGRELKNVQTGEFIGLVDNRTLPIKFRIEEDALCDPEPGQTCNAGSETVDLGDGQEDQVELRDETTGDQIGVLSIPPQNVPPGTQVTFTLEQCERLDADIPQFGDCLRITSDPPLTQAVGADGLNPPATISICRTVLIGPPNDLITVHRQDEETGEVFALPHAEDDCEDLVSPSSQGPAWDVGEQPAGQSPYTSLFRNALPVKMEYFNPDDAERSAAPGDVLTFAVKVTDAGNTLVTGGDPPAQVTFTVTEGETVSVLPPVPVVDGVAQITRTLGTGTTTVSASGVGLATPDNNGPAVDVFDPFWPGLHEEGVEKFPVLLGTGTLEFTVSTGPFAQKTVDLSDGVEDQVELRDENNNQIGVLTIPTGQALEAGQSGQITFTLELCEELNADIPQFGDCLRITSDPPLTQVVGADGLNPPATISLCRIGLIGTQNDLITVHRQDEETGQVFALPHATDDCEDVSIPEGSPGPAWDVGEQPAGESPFTSLFRNGLPVKFDYVNASDAERSGTVGAVLPTAVLVTDANGNTVDGARVTFEVASGSGAISQTSVLSVKGIAQVSWTLGAGANTLKARGHGIASPSLNGPAEGFDPFWPGLHVAGVEQDPVLLQIGALVFNATGTVPDGNTIFRATFSADALDAAPGAPEIGTWTTINQSSGTIRVRSAVGNLANRPVELNQVEGTGGLDLAGTVSGTPPTTGRWAVRWRSLINSSSAFFAPIVLRGSGGIIASLEYRASGQLTYNSPSNNTGVAWTQGTSQLFEILVDLDAHVTSLYVNGAPVAGQQNVSFAATSLERIGAEFGGTFAQVFAWDDIEIVRAPVAIDGVLSLGEWDGAATIDFQANIPGGGTTPARLFVRNDATNLYLAVRFARSVVDGENLLNFEFDNNNNGTGPENGDDYITFSFGSDPNAGVFSDAHRTGGGASVTTDGIKHGAAAFTNDGTFSVYEMSHPLNSGETGQDFALTPPTVIGMLLQLTVGSAHTVYPPGTFPTYVQINITSP